MTEDEDMRALAAASLQRGDWADARDAYQRALTAGEDAATLEGLAYACWWLQDDVTTIDSRRRAFRLYLEAHDPVSAARVAISLARDWPSWMRPPRPRSPVSSRAWTRPAPSPAA